MSRLSEQQQDLVGSLISAINSRQLDEVKRITSEPAFKLDKESFNRINNNLQAIGSQEKQQKYIGILSEHILEHRIHPDDYTLLYLAKYIYDEPSQGKVFNIERPDTTGHWKIHKVYNPNGEGRGYSGAIYINNETKQVVLSHRGSVFEIIDEYRTKEGSAETDIEGVVRGNIGFQQLSNFILTAYAVGLVKGDEENGAYKDYSLTFTGHSLGGWLAQLSTFYCKRAFDYHNARSVTFDSPGAKEMMEQMQAHVGRSKIDLEQLDIINYISSPNIVNSANTHVGVQYQVANTLVFPENSNFSGKVFAFPKKHCNQDEKGILSTMGHSLEYILEAFDYSTGRPKKYFLVNDWPSINYKGDGQDIDKPASEVTQEAAGVLFNHIIDNAEVFQGACGNTFRRILEMENVRSLIKSSATAAKILASKISGVSTISAIPFKEMIMKLALQYAGFDATLGSLSNFIVDLYEGKIETKEYFSLFEHLDDSYQKKEVSDNLVPRETQHFQLKFISHYDVTREHCIELDKQQKDLYVWKLKQAAEHTTIYTPLTQKIIREFNERVEIINNPDEPGVIKFKSKKSSGGFDVHRARELAKYIVSHIDPDNISKEIEIATKGDIQESAQLPLDLTTHNPESNLGDSEKFTQRSGPWGQLERVFQGQQSSNEGKLAIIHGPAGTGKTTLSVEYAKKNFDIVRQIKGVNSEDGIYQEYLNLARQLGIKTNFKKSEDLNIASHTSELQGPQKKSRAEEIEAEKKFLVSSVYTKLKKIIESGKSIVVLIDDLPSQDAYKAAEVFFNNLRANGVNIIVTTQHNNVAPGISKEQRIELEGFNDEEALSYLEDNIEGLKNRDIDGLMKLTKEETKTLPQVLKAVVSYFNKETDITFGEYKNKYEQAKANFAYKVIGLKPAYKVLLDNVVRAEPEAWKLLQYLEYLSPTTIPKRLLKKIPDIKFEDAMKALISQSLISSEEGNINTHQTVQDSIKQYREYLNETPIESLDESSPEFLAKDRVIGEEKVLRVLFGLVQGKFESFLKEAEENIGEGYYAKLRETNSYLPHALKLLKETDYADSAPEMYYYMYDSLGRYHEELGAYGQAIEYYEESIERIGESEVEERSDFLVGAHIAIGNCYEIKEGESIYHQSPQGLDKAKENYEEALKLVKGHDKSSAAYLSYRIGNIYRKKLEFKEAYKKFEEAIRIAEEQKEEDRDQDFIAKVYQAMGDTYRQEGNDLLSIISVEESYQKIKDYLTPGTHMLGRLPEGISPEEYQDIMKHQQNLIQNAFHWAFLEDERDTEKIRESIIKNNEGSSPADLYEKALEYIQKAIGIREKYLPKSQAPSISTYENLADNYRKIGDKESALTYYSKALEEYKNVLPEGWHEVIGEYQEIVNNQEVEQPIGYCQEFLSFLEGAQSSVLPIFRNTIKDAYVDLGNKIYNRSNNLEKAAKYYNKALELEGNEQEDGTLREIAEAYKGYGELCQDKKEAIECYKEALGLLSNSPINLAYQFNYNLNREFLPANKYELAVKLYERAFKWIKDQGISKSFTTSTDREVQTELKQVPLEGFDNTLFEALKNIGDNYVEEGAYELAIKHYVGTFELVIPNELHLFSRMKGYQYFSSLDYKEMSMLYSSLGLDEEAWECLKSQRVHIRKAGISENLRSLYLETRFKEMLQTIYEKTKQGIYSEGCVYDLNHYLEDDYLKDKLKKLGEKKEEHQMNDDIEKVQLLMLKYVSMAVVHGGMKEEQIEVLKSLAKDHVTLIFQARNMGVSCFIDKRIVEVLREVEVDDNYQYQQALYNVLEDFILKDVYEQTINGNRYGEGGSNNNGVKQYLEDNFLQKYLGQSAEFINNVYSITSLDSLKLDIFKEVCEAIVHNGMEHIEIIRSIAKEYKDLVIDAFFYRSLDKEIVETLKEVNKNDQEYQTALEIISLPYYVIKYMLYEAYIEAKSGNYGKVTECIEHKSPKNKGFNSRSDNSLENKLLILKYVSKAIVDSGMEHVGIIEELAKDYRELIIKAAQERPDYFLDKKIAEHLLKVHTDDYEYQEELKAVSVLLGVKAQIEPTLDRVYNQIKEANDNGGDNSELSVRQYLEDNSLKRELGNLYSAKNLEVAKLLVLKYIIQAIVSRNDEKYTRAIKEIAISDKELMVKAIQEHPGCFISWKVIKALKEIHTEDGDYQTALEIGSLPGDLNRKVKSALYEAYIQTEREDYKGVKKSVEQCSKDEDKLLVLKYVSKAIVDSGMEHVGIIEELAKDYRGLIIKAAQEHHDYFVDKKVVEHLLKVHTDDNEYQDTLAQILAEDTRGSIGESTGKVGYNEPTPYKQNTNKQTYEKREEQKNLKEKEPPKSPANDKIFISRVGLTQELQEALKAKPYVFITGESGTGKSTLAVDYALSNFDLVRQISETTEEAIYKEYLKIAEEIGIRKHSDTQANTGNNKLSNENDVIVKEVNQLLKRYKLHGKKVAFILDDLSEKFSGEIKKLVNGLTASNVKVIVISKNKEYIEGNGVLTVGALNKEEVSQYLSKALNNRMFGEEIKELVETITESEPSIQLLSVIAGYFNNNPDATLEDIKEIYDNSGDEAAKTLPEYKFLLDKIIEEHPQAWDTLQYIAYLSDRPIPEEILKNIIGKDFDNIFEKVLLPNSLVMKGNKPGTFISHSLVSNSIKEYRKHLENNGEKILSEKEIIKRLLQSIEEYFPLIGQFGKTWHEDIAKAELSLDHLKHTGFLQKNKGIDNSLTEIQLKTKLAYYHNKVLCKQDKAEELYEECIKYYNENEKDRTSIEVAKLHFELGSIYLDKNDKEEAEKEFNKARDLLNEEEPLLTARIHDSLGKLYTQKGSYDEALEYFNKSLSLRKDLGEENGLASSYNNIGNVYNGIGKYDEALSNYNKAFDIYKALHGKKTHIDTAIVLNNLGTAYSESNEHEKASKYLKKSLAMYQDIYYGDNHPSIAELYNNIGEVYRKTENLKEAEKYYNKAIKLHDKFYPKDSVGNAGYYNNLGLVIKGYGDYFKDQGRLEKALEKYDEAIDIYNGVLEKYEFLYDVEKSHIVASLYLNMEGAYVAKAQVYLAEGGYEKAEMYYHTALDYCDSAHKIYKNSKFAPKSNVPKIYEHKAGIHLGLAGIYSDNKEYELAAKHYKEFMELQKVVPQVDYTLFTTACLDFGNICKGLGEYKEAIKYFQKAFNLLKEKFGEGHSNTHTAREQLINLEGFIDSENIILEGFRETKISEGCEDANISVNAKNINKETFKEYCKTKLGISKEDIEEVGAEFLISLDKKSINKLRDMCKTEAGEVQDRYSDDEDDDASAGAGPSGYTPTASSSNTDQVSASASDNRGQNDSNNDNKENSRTTDNETSPSKEALLAVIEEIENHGALIHDERLKAQLEHYAKTGVIYKTLAPYVQAVQEATHFRESIDRNKQVPKDTEHISQELIDKILNHVEKYDGIAINQKLVEQLEHYIRGGEVYDTLRLYNEEANALGNYFTYQNCSTLSCVQEAMETEPVVEASPFYANIDDLVSDY